VFDQVAWLRRPPPTGEVRRVPHDNGSDVTRHGHGDHGAVDHLTQLDACVVPVGHDVDERVTSRIGLIASMRWLDRCETLGR
jgi:hypothetical protein